MMVMRRLQRFALLGGSERRLLIEAHAWVDAAGVEVTGYPVTVFSEIGCFV